MMGKTTLPSRQIRDGGVQTADLADLNVTTAKLADSAATFSKILIAASNPCLEDDGSGGLRLKAAPPLVRSAAGIGLTLATGGGLEIVSDALQVKGARLAAVDPAADADLVYHSTQKRLKTQISGDLLALGGVLQVSAASTNMITANAVAAGVEQQFDANAQYVVPGDFLVEQRVLRLRFSGRYAIDAGATMTVRAYIGSVNVYDSGGLDPLDSASVNRPWSLDLYLVCSGAGTSGSVRASSSLGLPGLSPQPGNAGDQTLNTTINNTIKLGVAFSTATANNRCYCGHMIIEALN